MMPPSTIEHSFSVDEVPNPMSSSTLLQPPPVQQPQVVGGGGGGAVATREDAGGLMSPGEWSFERLLEEELMRNNTPPPPPQHVLDSNGGDPVLHVVAPVLADAAVEVQPANIVTAGGGTATTTATTADPIEYNAMLKRKLEEDLAAIAMWRASSAVHPEGSQGWNAYNNGGIPQQGWHAYNNGVARPYQGSSNPAQNTPRDGGTGHHHVPNAYITSKFPAARSSSVDASPSDDDDVDGEVEVQRFRKPDAERVKRRKESNRESARRSRSRKAAHVKELEDQVTNLKSENSVLLSRLDALSQKYSASAIDNRILRADMETLRVKLKMAEDTVNRLSMGTSTSSLFSSLPFVGSPSTHATHHDPSPPIIHDNNSYVPRANNGGYQPRAAAPSPLQAEGGVVNGSSSNSTSRQINRVAAARAAASHCATAAMAEILHQERVSAMPPSSSSAGVGVAPWEPSGLGYEINGANMEGR